ncbi:MAG: FAD-binding oxidoreductase, partial [Gammaproteobacteria bacterium]|nr:FAD-binding oxidoreductase [Gammaproteobacteria bacterium]
IARWSCVPQSLPGLWRHIPGWLLDPEGPVAVRWRYLARFTPWALRFLRVNDKESLPDTSDAMLALVRPNVELYRHHLKDTSREDLVVDSKYVHVYRNPEDCDPNSIEWRLRAKRGVPFNVVKGEELFEIEPALSRDIKAAMLIHDQARAMDPGAVGRTLAEKAQKLGAHFRQEKVHALKPNADDTWTLETDQGSSNCSKVLLAAGAWSARLLKPLGVSVPLEAERGYHLVFRNPGITLQNSIMDTDNKTVSSSMSAGVRCAGTAEFAGLNTPPDYQRARMLKKLNKGLFPQLNVDEPEEWMGSRPSFPDSLPVIGETPGHKKLFVAFGHCHFGFSMAPNTGKVIAEIINNETPSIDITPYSIDRF